PPQIPTRRLRPPPPEARRSPAAPFPSRLRLATIRPRAASPRSSADLMSATAAFAVAAVRKAAENVSRGDQQRRLAAVGAWLETRAGRPAPGSAHLEQRC